MNAMNVYLCSMFVLFFGMHFIFDFGNDIPSTEDFKWQIYEYTASYYPNMEYELPETNDMVIRIENKGKTDLILKPRKNGRINGVKSYCLEQSHVAILTKLQADDYILQDRRMK